MVYNISFDKLLLDLLFPQYRDKNPVTCDKRQLTAKNKTESHIVRTL